MTGLNLKPKRPTARVENAHRVELAKNIALRRDRQLMIRLSDVALGAEEQARGEAAHTSSALSAADKLVLALMAQRNAFDATNEPSPGTALDAANERVLEAWKTYEDPSLQ